MRSFGTLLLAFLVSSFVGAMAQTLLAVAFDADVEFIGIISLFVLCALAATVAFGIAFVAAKRARIIDWVALGLLAAAVLMVAAFALVGSGGKAIAISRQDLPIIAEIMVPTAVMIGIQWWMVRRRWLRAQAAIQN
jgi:hypothetical protein